MSARIDLPWTRPPLSLNDRLHWRAKAQKVAAVRQTGAILARGITPTSHATVTLHYRPRDRRARDTANLHATLKPLTDGLVDAGVLTHGDSFEYVTERCLIHPAQPGVAAGMWLTVEPQETT